MSIISRLRHWTSPACAVPRLRVLYLCSLALCGASLVMLHLALAGEQRLAHALTVETRAAVAAPRFIILRVPSSPVRTLEKAKSNIHRTPTAPRKEK